MKTLITLILITFTLLVNFFSIYLLLEGHEVSGGIINGFLIGGLFAWAKEQRSKKIYAIALTKPLKHGGTNLQLVITPNESMEGAIAEALEMKEGYEFALALDYVVKL